MKGFLLAILGLFLGWIQFWIHCCVHIAAAITAVIHISSALNRKRRNTDYTSLSSESSSSSAVSQNNSRRQRSFQQSQLSTQLLLKQQQKQKMYRTQQNQPEAKKRPSYVQRLPNEVLMVVFEMVGTGGRKADLLNCTLVSKLWHDLVTPVLWRAPIPTQPICWLSSPSTLALLSASSSSSSSSSSTSSSYSFYSSNSTLSPPSSSSSSSSSCFSNSNGLRSNKWHTSHPQKEEQKPYQTYSKTSSPDMEVKDVHRVSTGFPIHLPKYGHAIRNLTLSSPALHITDCSVRHILKYCPNLVSLQLANCRHITNDSLRSLSRAQCAPHLRVLNLQNCVQVSDTGLTYLAAECSSLEIIQLGGCVRISHQGVTHLVKASSRTLRRLCLSDCGRVTGVTIHQIAKLCRTRLEWLDIARIGAVQHADLAALVSYCPNLTRLNLARPKSMLLRQLQQHRQEQRRLQHQQYRSSQQTQTQTQNDDDYMLPLLESQVNPLDELIDMLRRYNVQPAISSLFAHNQRFEQQYQQLAKLDDVSDASLELIITQLPRLAHLDLSHWTCLTDGAICVLAKHGLALTHLNLSGCKNITYRVFGYLSSLCHRNEKLTNITLGEFVPLHEPPPLAPTNPSTANTSPANTSPALAALAAAVATTQARRRVRRPATGTTISTTTISTTSTTATTTIRGTGSSSSI